MAAAMLVLFGSCDALGLIIDWSRARTDRGRKTLRQYRNCTAEELSDQEAARTAEGCGNWFRD
jgi:hypothetical protein